MSVRFGGKLDTYETLLFLEERVGLGLFVWDLETDMVEWSDGLFSLFGLKIGSVPPSTTLFLSMTHPEDRISSSWLRHEAIEGRLLDRDFRIVLRDGRVRYLTQRARLLNDEGARRLCGALIDVTPLHDERNHSEIMQRRFRALVHAFGGMVWLARFDGGVIDAFSLSSTDDISSASGTGNWTERVYAEDRPALLAAWEAGVRQHAPFRINHRLDQPDGSTRWYQTRGAPQLDDHGAVLAWIGVTIEIEGLIGGQSDQSAITGAQIRGARGILNWSVRDLAEAADVSVSVLRRIEGFDGAARGDPEASTAIRQALERGGVEFFSSPLGKAGVRPR